MSRDASVSFQPLTMYKQIWFQNRRQIQRRKSRPLLPHEIVAFGIGSLAGLSSDPASAPIFRSQNMEEPPSPQEDEAFNTQELDNANAQELPDLSEPQHVETRVEAAKDEPERVTENTPSSLPPSILALSPEPSSGIAGIEGSSFPVKSVFKSFSSTPGYLANRWNTIHSTFSTPTSSQPAQFTTPNM